MGTVGVLNAPYLVGLNGDERPIITGTETDYFGPFGANIGITVSHLPASNARPIFDRWANSVDEFNGTRGEAVVAPLPPTSLDMSECGLIDRAQFYPAFSGASDVAGVTVCLTDSGTFVIAYVSGRWKNDYNDSGKYVIGVDASDHVVDLVLREMQM